MRRDGRSRIASALPGRAAVVILLALSGCAATYRDLPRVDARTAIPPSRGYRLSRPDFRQAATGLKAWGRICRSALALSPRGVRLELADERDQVLAAGASDVTPSLRRGRRCGFYSIATDWRLSAGRHLHLCPVPYFGSRATPCGQGDHDEALGS